VLAVLLVSFHFVQLDALAGESGRREIGLSVRPGYTIDRVEDRRFRLSTRRAASECTVNRPTVLMFGDSWIPILNGRWTLDPEHRMYRRLNTPLYLSKPILDEAEVKRLAADGFRLVVWEGAKWEYVRGGFKSWQEYVDVVDNLGAFFNVPVEGRWKTDRRR
ncbi:MAG: hypothetical protein P8181_10720, partial [bacterium]